MKELVLTSLDIMWKGMLAIFLVTAVLFGLLHLLSLIKPKKNKDKNAPDGETTER